jgi:aspartyl protease family protein
MLRAVAGIIIVATFVGALMPAPRAKAGADAAQPAAEPWFAESSTSTSSSSSGASSSSSGGGTSSGEVRLVRNRDGHFYADVAVNGTSLEFLIDTGASGIALTAEDAERAGIRLDPSERTYVGEGAGGALSGQMVRLDRVKLGGRSAEGMVAAVIDGSSTNLLGQSFLERFEEVTVRGDVMTLR